MGNAPRRKSVVLAKDSDDGGDIKDDGDGDGNVADDRAGMLYVAHLCRCELGVAVQQRGMRSLVVCAHAPSI